MSTETSAVPRTDILRGILIMLLAVLSVHLPWTRWSSSPPARHPTGQIVFFRNPFAMLPLSFFICKAGGIAILRTRRLGSMCCARWAA